MKVEVLESIVEGARSSVVRVRLSTIWVRAGHPLNKMYPDRDFRGQIKAWAKHRGLTVAFDTPEEGMARFES